MTELDCKELVRQYADWLKTKMVTTEVNGFCEVTTPFLDRHNDHLQIYIQRNDSGGFRLSDDGYILGDLEATGCSPDSEHRQAMLSLILRNYGVSNAAGELFVDATPGDFPRKKHALLQAMLSVNDMFMTATPRVASLFFEDVQKFLEDSDVRFSPRVAFTGKSGFPHKFDFLIPKSKKKPERLIRAINSPNRAQVQNLLFAWTDTRDVRPPDSVVYAILNDQGRAVDSDVIGAFEQYSVKAIPWSKRHAFQKELAA